MVRAGVETICKEEEAWRSCLPRKKMDELVIESVKKTISPDTKITICYLFRGTRMMDDLVFAENEGQRGKHRVSECK